MGDLLLLIVLTGGTILIATWFLGARSIEQLSKTLIDRTTLRTEEQLDGFFGSVSTQVLAGRDWARAEILNPTDPLAMNKLFVPILRHNPHLSSMMIADSDGVEYLLLRTPLDPNEWSNRVVEADRKGTDVYNRKWNTKTGEVKEKNAPLEYDPRTRVWYEQALLTTDEEPVFWTEPVIFFVTKDPGITASTHLVFDSDPPRTVVVAYDLLLMDISKFTTSLEVSDRGKAFVLFEDADEGQFKVIGLPRDERFPDDQAIRDTLVPSLGKDAVVDSQADLPSPAELKVPSVFAVMEAWEQGERPQQPVRFSSGGEYWWGGLRPFSVGDNTFWIGVVVPEQDLSGTIRMQQWVLMGIVLGVLGVGMYRSGMLARRFSAPIKQLVDQSERISRGDLETGAAIASDVGEIRRLADAHDQMRDGLKSVIKLEKLERDLDIARDIQLGLLPDEAPLTPGFEVAGKNRPADKTGGDYYDWLTMPDGRTLFTLADVAGHGIGPALIVAVYRAYMRASTSDGEAVLRTVAAKLNDLLCDDMPEGRFITAAIGLVDPGKNEVRLLSAGQAPLLYYEAATDTLHNWDADDMPLGIVSGVEFTKARQILFAPGDLLVLTTDGFFEAENSAGEAFGIHALEQFIRENHHRPPAELIERLYERIDQHAAGAPQGDDLTAVVVKCSVE